MLLGGCVAAEQEQTEHDPTKSADQSYSGWYMESAGQRTFQPCGQAQRLRVISAADLPAKAKAFGLQTNTPVYVKLTGSNQGDLFTVSRVEQFGSPTPVRNCAMDGVVIPARGQQ
ncbi:MAG: hypothetical protein ABIP16_06890 [Thermomonas sp.]